jgi:hypothetical protein
MIRALFVITVALLSIAAPRLSASLVVPAGFREVVTEATAIVRGRVTDVRAIDTGDNGIETVGTVAVDSTLKGPSVQFIAVRVPGGVIGRYRQVMVGAPTLRVGQQAVFFLKRGPDDAWRPIGLTQGLYRVRADAVTRRLVVQPPVLGGWTTAAGAPVERGDRRRTSMAVPEFESLVKAVIASPPRRAIPRGGPRGGR